MLGNLIDQLVTIEQLKLYLNDAQANLYYAFLDFI
jgi:hypothetical protein